MCLCWIHEKGDMNMPRGVKGSGKAAAPKKANAGRKEKAPEKKVRKAYPTFEERILLADQKIDRLIKIIDSRRKLIQKAEADLNTRIDALNKNTDLLLKAISRKEQLLSAKRDPSDETVPETGAPIKKPKPRKESSSKMTPEELKAFRVELMAKARAARKAKSGKQD